MNGNCELNFDELDIVAGGMMNIVKDTNPNGRTHGGSNSDDKWIDPLLGFALGGFWGLAATLF